MERRHFGVSVCLLAMLVMVGLLAGCSSEGDEPAGAVGETASATISADGGSLATASGSAALSIPAGALDSDTEISINTLAAEGQPDAANLGSLVFDLGPDGLAFKKPVTLELKLGGAVPEGKKAHLATLDGGEWKTISGSAVAEGYVIAEIDHFSLYVIIFLPDGGSAIITDESACQELDFSACGGDGLVGRWLIQDYCLTHVSDDEISNPFAEIPECSDWSFGMDVAWEGFVEFKADGSGTASLGRSAMEAVVMIDDDCLAYLGTNSPGVETPTDDPEEVCTMMDTPREDGSKFFGDCTYGSGQCKCVQDMSDEIENQGEPVEFFYDTEGSNLKVGSSAESKDKTFPFCVEGDKLVLQWHDDGDNIPDYMILNRE